MCAPLVGNMVVVGGRWVNKSTADKLLREINSNREKEREIDFSQEIGKEVAKLNRLKCHIRSLMNVDAADNCVAWIADWICFLFGLNCPIDVWFVSTLLHVQIDIRVVELSRFNLYQFDQDLFVIIIG